MVHRRILVITLFAWLPLLVLAVLEGRAFGRNVAVPFLMDVDVQVRFLVVVPLLIGVELVVHRHAARMVQQFLERQLVPSDAMRQFDAALELSMHL